VPEFMIIGWWKCGTTGLHKYLTEHSQILPSSVKELKYFSLSKFSYYPDFIETYKAQFPCGLKNQEITFEATPSYAVFGFAPVRIKASFPELKKFILCIRNPVDRAYSYFQMMVRREKDNLMEIYLLHECILTNRDFYMNTTNIELKDNICLNQTNFIEKFSVSSDAHMFDTIIRGQLLNLRYCLSRYRMDMETTLYECPRLLKQFLSASLYYYHYTYWLKFYPKESFLIINHADLLNQKTFPFTMRRVVEFLSLEPHTWQPPPTTVASKYPPMWDSTKRLLKDFFREPNENFYKLVGFDFGW